MTKEAQQVVFLKGRRVVLRPVLEEDIPMLLRWINDPEVSLYLNAYMPKMEAEEREWFQNLHNKKSNNIVVTIVADNKAIGTMGIHSISWKDGTATTGTVIGEKEYWGKGYGTEAKMLLLNYAFNTLNLRKICSVVLAFNERSHKYGLKCGYREEGRLREHHFKNGKYWDEILLAVFKEEWLLLWDEFVKKHDIPVLDL